MCLSYRPSSPVVITPPTRLAVALTLSGGQGIEDDLEGNRIVGKPEAVIPAITGLTAEGRSCKLLWQRLDVVPVCTASFGGRDGQDQPTWLDRKTLVCVRRDEANIY